MCERLYFTVFNCQQGEQSPMYVEYLPQTLCQSNACFHCDRIQNQIIFLSAMKLNVRREPSFALSVKVSL